MPLRQDSSGSSSRPFCGAGHRVREGQGGEFFKRSSFYVEDSLRILFAHFPIKLSDWSIRIDFPFTNLGGNSGPNWKDLIWSDLIILRNVDAAFKILLSIPEYLNGFSRIFIIFFRWMRERARNPWESQIYLLSILKKARNSFMSSDDIWTSEFIRTEGGWEFENWILSYQQHYKGFFRILLDWVHATKQRCR